MKTDREIRKPIPGVPPGYYEVSNWGYIYRVAGGRGASPGKRLTFGVRPRSGRKSVTLSIRNVHYEFLVARVVASAFLGERPPKYEVNHKDGNPANDHVGNLEWVTHAENIVHAERNGLYSRCARGKLSPAKVGEIRRLATSMTQVALGRKFGVSQGTIWGVLRRRNWKQI